MSCPSVEILCNLCNNIFLAREHLNLEITQKEQWETTLNKLLGVINFKANFKEETLSYIMNVEESVYTTREFSKKYYKHFFKKTYYRCSDFDVSCMEDILNNNFYIAGSIGAVLDCIGYVVVKEDERWRLRWCDNLMNEPVLRFDQENAC